MKITSIELEHTNPSLGPHEEITIVALTVNTETQPRVDEFIETAKVNHTISLKEYLQASLDKNDELIKEVKDKGPRGQLTRGSKVSYLSFHFQGGESIRMADVYRTYTLSDFYPDFTKFMVEKGEIQRYKPWEGSKEKQSNIPKKIKKKENN